MRYQQTHWTLSARVALEIALSDQERAQLTSVRLSAPELVSAIDDYIAHRFNNMSESLRNYQ